MSHHGRNRRRRQAKTAQLPRFTITFASRQEPGRTRRSWQEWQAAAKARKNARRAARKRGHPGPAGSPQDAYQAERERLTVKAARSRSLSLPG